MAAKGGYLECLQYAHEQGCPWNEETCISAAENDHPGVSSVCPSREVSLG